LKKNFFAFAILACFFSSTSFAQPFEKNGMPCVKEICIGDGLTELNGIKWIRAQTALDFAVSAERRKIDGVLNTYADQPVPKSPTYPPRDFSFLKGNVQDIRKAYSYLYSARFDSGALPLIAKIEVACEGASLFGRFDSESGFPTVVNIEMIPAIDGLSQKWQVTEITRFFPSNATREQYGELNRSFYTTYADFPTGGNAKGAYARLNENKGLLYGYGLKDRANHSQFLKHPLCGAFKGKIQLN